MIPDTPFLYLIRGLSKKTRDIFSKVFFDALFSAYSGKIKVQLLGELSWNTDPVTGESKSDSPPDWHVIAKSWCLISTKQALEQKGIIVVSNPFISALDLLPYIELADKVKSPFQVITVENRDKDVLPEDERKFYRFTTADKLKEDVRLSISPFTTH